MSQSLKFNLLDRPKPTHDPSYKTMIILYKKNKSKQIRMPNFNQSNKTYK
jgi:hypothetical protein